MPEYHILFFEDKHSKRFESYFGWLDLQYNTERQKQGFQVVKSKWTTSGTLKGSQFEEKARNLSESFESKLLKQKQHCVAVAVAFVVS